MGFLKNLKSQAHPQHPVSLAYVNEPFLCDSCDDIGIGCCYQCKDPGCVDIQLHEECARPEPITWHPFCSGCQFTLINPSTRAADTIQNIICKACGTHVGGMFYACLTHGSSSHFIHPMCMKLKPKIQLPGMDMVLNGNVPRKCALCGHKHAFDGIKGWSYVSTSGDLCLHIKCVKQMMLENWKKVYLSNELGININAPATSSTATMLTFHSSVNTVSMPLVVHQGSTRRTTPLSTLKQAGKNIKLFAKALLAVVSSYFGASATIPGTDVIIQALTSE